MFLVGKCSSQQTGLLLSSSQYFTSRSLRDPAPEHANPGRAQRNTADKAKKTIKKGSMVTVAKKTQAKTDEDYKLKGKKINWSVTSGKDVCSVKTSSSGKVSVKGKKKGTCTVKAKASKVKRKYKSFTEFYNFQVK